MRKGTRNMLARLFVLVAILASTASTNDTQWPGLTCRQNPPADANDVMSIPRNTFGTLLCELELKEGFDVTHFDIHLRPTNENEIYFKPKRKNITCIWRSGRCAAIRAIIKPSLFFNKIVNVEVRAQINGIENLKEKFKIKITSPAMSETSVVTTTNSPNFSCTLDPAMSQDNQLTMQSSSYSYIVCEIETEEDIYSVSDWSAKLIQENNSSKTLDDQFIDKRNSGLCLSRNGTCSSMLITIVPDMDFRLIATVVLNYLNGTTLSIDGRPIDIHVIESQNTTAGPPEPATTTTEAEATQNIADGKAAIKPEALSGIIVGGVAVVAVAVLVVLGLVCSISKRKNKKTTVTPNPA